jgi:hypothetical protein
MIKGYHTLMGWDAFLASAKDGVTSDDTAAALLLRVVPLPPVRSPAYRHTCCIGPEMAHEPQSFSFSVGAPEMVFGRPSILLSVGFLHRRTYRKITRQSMPKYGLNPLDYLNDGVPFPSRPALATASDLTMASDLMRKADGYLAVIDTQYIMKPDKGPAEAVKH